MSDFIKLVYECVEKMPKGKISTYGRVAKKIGKRGAARAVGNALGKYEKWEEGNCYRVVRSNGEVGGYRGGEKYVKEKIKKLKVLGCKIKNGRIVNLEEKLW